MRGMKMLPKVVLHNSISLDGSFIHFDVNMGLHYQIASKYRPDVHLIGSKTAKTGLELEGAKVPHENLKDFEKPRKDQALPYWVIPDTKGSLQGRLHSFRRFEGCRDVIVLISEDTPTDYIHYLEERHYEFHIVGKKHVDLSGALALLSQQYDVKTVLTDTGRVLGNLLLNQGLVFEISLLIHPIIVGKHAENLFTTITDEVQLRLCKREMMDQGYVWLVYQIEK